MSINTNVKIGSLQKQLSSLYFLMKDNKDDKNATKIMDLYEKFQSKEYIIGFSGHFSAGKSSMINYLLKEDLLPKSPIPTSANIVKITSRNNGAHVFFNNGEYASYQAPYDINLIKEYCKDKETISQIELSSTNIKLPTHCSLFDTPGIDAADDTDRLITESSLHLVDHMIYVVDYNHIQSEVNLLFLQKLQKMYIPYDLVVNQIDKHDEDEIPLELLREKVKQTFDQWSLTPCHTYFTSLTEIDLEINELEIFECHIYSKLKNKQSNLESSVEFLLKEHEQFLVDSYQEEAPFLNSATAIDQEDESRLEELKQLISELKAKPDQIYHELNEAIGQSLKNAYIMPAQLRDIAYSFLESQEKNFKVGILRSNKKTTEEKNKRTEQFLSSLMENIEASLKWKIRDKLHQVVKSFHLKSEKIRNDIQQLDICYTSEDLIRLTNPGAKVNGDYLLNYTNDISNDIKHKYKRQLNEIVSEIVELAKEKYSQYIIEYEKEYNQLADKLSAHQELTTIQNTLKAKIAEIEQVFNSQTENKNVVHKMEQQMKTRYTLVERFDDIRESQHENAATTNEKPGELTSGLNTTAENSVVAILSAIDATVQTVENMPGFESIIRNLSSKYKSLTDRQFTIALFGAFSAGKSSFANALIEERLLPTSPNPTTAVINKVAPPDKDNHHGSIVIMFKDNVTLIEDLYTIVKSVSNIRDVDRFDDYENLLHWISENDIQNNEYLDNTLQTVLQAMLHGFEANKMNINTQLQISLEQFESYITDETVAAYIESVTLYYDCSITQRGITLVDTPGADSINARHTNVAFDYIKHADMILYVTYYNHALSRADKNFLLQLGRVKDSFELDKLYFIINAIDLAIDQQEIALVTKYVESQLLELGIRFPKIYPVSSRTALEDIYCNEENKHMELFKNDLFHFVEYQLSEVIIQSAITEVQRVKQTMDNFLHTKQLDKKEQEQLRNDLLETQSLAENITLDLTSNVYNDRLQQRIDKQLYHVEERLSIRFHDMFKEKFNPTTITESGRQTMKQLEFNMNDLIDYVGYELLQEIRAVALRVESFMRMLFNEANTNVVEQIKEMENQFMFSSVSEFSLDTPQFNQPMTHIDYKEFKKPLSLFKGTKSFFEKNEKELMKEEIYDDLSPYIKNHLESINTLMLQSYNQQWNTLVDNRKEQMNFEIDTYVKNNLDITMSATNIDTLKQKSNQLKEIITKVDGEEAK